MSTERKVEGSVKYTTTSRGLQVMLPIQEKLTLGPLIHNEYNPNTRTKT
jgi:hypothetical protein